MLLSIYLICLLLKYQLTALTTSIPGTQNFTTFLVDFVSQCISYVNLLSKHVIYYISETKMQFYYSYNHQRSEMYITICDLA